MSNRALFVAALVLTSAAIAAGPPWDKPPQNWSQSDAYRILQDSPWSPAKVSLDARYTFRHTDPQSGLVTDNPSNPSNTNPVRGVEISREKPLPSIPVLWWSSKTVRLARLRLHQLREPSSLSSPLIVETLPDLVLVIEGGEAMRIFREPNEDLHDTVFLELEGGATLDLKNVEFVEEGDSPRVEFHFPRSADGRPAIDPNSERIILHCKATEKMPRAGRRNEIALRAEFHLREMRVRGTPDL